MKTTLRQLSYFIAAAEHGSASQAATAINISQPSVSTAIRDLELVFGQPLFHRLYAKGLSLTPFGQRKLLEARRLVEDAQGFEHGADSDLGADLHGAVAFGYFTALGPSHIPALLRYAGARHPHLNIDLANCNLEQISERLRNGRMEMALTYDVGITGSITRETLAEFEPYAVVPAGHRLARHKTISLHDLASEPFVLMDLPLSREFLLTPFWQHGLDPDVHHLVDSVEMVRGMVANGHGVSLLITRPTHNRAYDGRTLISRPLTEKVMAQKLVAAYTSAHPPTRAASALLACMQDYFSTEEARLGMPIGG